MTRLVVNADDFGQTSGVNMGILEAHRLGIVTSTTILANGDAFEEAVGHAASNPSLGVGVHINFVEGRPVSPSDRVGSLLSNGRLLSKFQLMRRHLLGRLNLDELRMETEAQIDRVQKAGISPTHVDSHQHLHAFPPFFPIIARVAESRGIRSIRFPCERLTWSDAVRAPFGITRTVALNAAAARCRRALRECALNSTSTFGGTLRTGRLTPDWLVGWLGRLEHPTAELMVHPGKCDDALRQTGSRLLASRDEELSALTHPAVVAAIEKFRIRLIHYGELIEPA